MTTPTTPLFRLVAWTSLVCGSVGGVVGLVLGLRSYAPTAWFAVLEVGVPAALLGGAAALLAGLLLSRRPRVRGGALRS